MGYRKLGRNSAMRKALMRDLITDLIINEKIETTLYKAKELQRLADKMITLGKKGDLAAIRMAAKMIRFEEEVKENEKGEVVKHQFAIQKLFKDLAPTFKERQGGYTRILKTGFRQGDAAPMALIEFVK